MIMISLLKLLETLSKKAIQFKQLKIYHNKKTKALSI